METSTATESPLDPSPSRAARVLRHPALFVSVAVILVLLFSWTFIIHPKRGATRSDPAYYSWRIESLISDKPSDLVRITGPFRAFAGGYRVAGTVLGSYLRRVAGVSQLKTTIVLDVTQWSVIALLLGGFAYRQRRDPLIFYLVVAASAGLLLAPPFIGYEDNVLCLLFLAAAIWFLPGATRDWRARGGLALFLIVSGFTHPTTLAIFCLALLAMAFLRLIATRFDVRSTVRLDGPVLATAATAVVVTYVSWTAGVWGVSESLSAAALPPPKSSGAFIQKLLFWVREMYPPWNAPLMAIGLIGVIVVLWRRRAEEDLSRIFLGWLVPLVGLFGFLFGLTYPYYRFFNSTLAWILLVGVGAYIATRTCIAVAGRGGPRRLALLGVLVVLVALATTLSLKLTDPAWNRAHGGWLTPSNRHDLDALRSALNRPETAHRPVVFVVDLFSNKPSNIYGFAKVNGNVSRYGLPSGEIDNGYLYLGSLTRFLAGKPTLTGNHTYDRLSRGYLADAQRGIKASGRRPIVVLENNFNHSGRNAKFFHGAPRPSPSEVDLWLVYRGSVITSNGPISRARPAPPPGAWHLAAVAGGLLLLLLPGLIGVRRVFPHASVAEMLGMVPALSMALLALAGIVVLAISRASFSGLIPWASLALALVLAVAIPRRGLRDSSPS